MSERTCQFDSDFAHKPGNFGFRAFFVLSANAVRDALGLYAPAVFMESGFGEVFSVR